MGTVRRWSWKATIQHPGVGGALPHGKALQCRHAGSSPAAPPPPCAHLGGQRARRRIDDVAEPVHVSHEDAVGGGGPGGAEGQNPAACEGLGWAERSLDGIPAQRCRPLPATPPWLSPPLLLAPWPPHTPAPARPPVLLSCLVLSTGARSFLPSQTRTVSSKEVDTTRREPAGDGEERVREHSHRGVGGGVGVHGTLCTHRLEPSWRPGRPWRAPPTPAAWGGGPQGRSSVRAGPTGECSCPLRRWQRPGGKEM